jgi:raffinose/stachyose/melibiose transport system substrate-binding protein
MNALLRTTALAALALTCAARAGAGTLTLESWRTDDKTLWDTVLLPAFTKTHPGITVKFTPTAPPEYNSVVAARLA